MACREYESRLAELEDFLDGRLDARAMSAIENHLDVCAACRLEMQEARLGARLLREGMEPSPEPSAFFWTRLRARLREVAVQPRETEFWAALELLSRRLALTSALALLVMGGYLVGVDLRQPNSATPQRTEARDVVPDSVRQPATDDDVLLSLARFSNGNGNGR